jgi:hypothetical protein
MCHTEERENDTKYGIEKVGWWNASLPAGRGKTGVSYPGKTFELNNMKDKIRIFRIRMKIPTSVSVPDFTG